MCPRLARTWPVPRQRAHATGAWLTSPAPLQTWTALRTHQLQAAPRTRKDSSKLMLVRCSRSSPRAASRICEALSRAQHRIEQLLEARRAPLRPRPRSRSPRTPPSATGGGAGRGSFAAIVRRAALRVGEDLEGLGHGAKALAAERDRPGLRSGWRRRASFWYARRISAALARLPHAEKLVRLHAALASRLSVDHRHRGVTSRLRPRHRSRRRPSCSARKASPRPAAARRRRPSGTGPPPSGERRV